jgi:CheY-like chemotaxis protein
MLAGDLNNENKCNLGIRDKNVLIVDDNPGDAYFVKLWLLRMGCRVTIVESGRDAVEKHAQGAFDLVLVNLELPGMDGFETAKAIRASQIEDDRKVSIFALTWHADDSLMANCLAEGMDAFLTKPICPSKLAVCMGHALRKDPPKTAEPVPTMRSDGLRQASA